VFHDIARALEKTGTRAQKSFSGATLAGAAVLGQEKAGGNIDPQEVCGAAPVL
jgi:hypothetical protein